ncbi:hypothetical protein ACOMHN_055966 [Nucella lapillus]
MAAAASDCEPSLQNIIDQISLKWIFVGGKGGVGKTTTSCSLAIQLSRVRESVLIISADPAHSLSDAFGQTFSKEPQLVEGFTNLYAMEHTVASERPDVEMPENPSEENQWQKMLSEAAPKPEGFPGIDEFLSMRLFTSLLQSMQYSVVVFDLAPTGHALRFIGQPLMWEQCWERMGSAFTLLRGVATTALRLFGKQASTSNESIEDIFGGIISHMRNPAKTTFVGVCTAEFLSLYETERLIQRLTVYGIDSHNLVVNQLLFSDTDDHHLTCARCSSRRTMQEKYLTQINSLYQDIHVTKLPLLETEVRGVDMLEPFSHLLLHPSYNPPPPPSPLSSATLRHAGSSTTTTTTTTTTTATTTSTSKASLPKPGRSLF